MYLSAVERIENWLLHSPIQIESGVEAGAVAGWLNECGASSFVYPEITGYYLTWLAFAGQFSPQAVSLVRERAGKCAAWLVRRAMDPTPPPTREYLHPQNEDDWRNLAVFSFDIAMLARGIVHAGWLAPLLPWQPLLEQHLAYLLDLCTFEGTLRPVMLRNGHQVHELPFTWSTVEGVHHVKTAAAILSVPAALRPAHLSTAAQRLLGCWVGEPWQRLRAMPLHPLFYYLEGLISVAVTESDPTKIAEVAAVYAQVMRQQDAGGFLSPEPGFRSGLPRSDVTAQALRIGSLLRAWGYLQGNGWDARLGRLAAALLRFVRQDGAVSQYPLESGLPPQWNAWSSMFTHQAFAFYDSLVERKASTAPSYYSELLI